MSCIRFGYLSDNAFQIILLFEYQSMSFSPSSQSICINIIYLIRIVIFLCKSLYELVQLFKEYWIIIIRLGFAFIVYWAFCGSGFVHIGRYSVYTMKEHPEGQFKPFVFGFLYIPFIPFIVNPCIFALLGFQIFPQHSDVQNIGIISCFAFFHLFPKNFGSIDVAFIVACSLKRSAFFVHHPSHGRIFQYGGQIRAIVYPFVHLGLK